MKAQIEEGHEHQGITTTLFIWLVGAEVVRGDLVTWRWSSSGNGDQETTSSDGAIVEACEEEVQVEARKVIDIHCEGFGMHDGH